MSEAIKAQLEVKSKCEQMQQSLKELHDWEQDMKRKEAQSRQQKEVSNLSRECTCLVLQLGRD